MTKQKIEKDLCRVKDQIAALQEKEKYLEEQKQMIEDAEKMKFLEKHKISLEQLILLNQISEKEIRSLLQQREEQQLLEEIEKEEREKATYENQEILV